MTSDEADAVVSGERVEDVLRGIADRDDTSALEIVKALVRRYDRRAARRARHEASEEPEGAAQAVS